MNNNSLTENDKLVLYGLVRYPLQNNRELSETIGLNQSTVTAIHRKLKERGYVKTVIIPLLQEFGCEVLAVTYGTFSSSVPLKTRLQMSKKIAEKQEEVFWAVSESTQGISFQLSRDYTNVKRNVEELEKVYHKENLTREPSISLLVFPFELTNIMNYFDYAPFLKSTFGIDDIIKEKTGTQKKTIKDINLNDKEKHIYHSLIKFPQLSDKKLAEEINISRYKVARERKRFEENLLIKTIRIVDLQKVGFDILVLNHMMFDMNISSEKKEEGIKTLMNRKQPIFMLVGEIDGISLVPYESFEDFREHSGKIADINKRYGLFSKETKSLLFSTKTMTFINNHDYANITHKILDI